MFIRKRHKVLIVDDDEAILALQREILSDAKYKVFKARNGRECIDQAKKFSPDIIVLDVMMPELDGIATLLKLKSIKDTRFIPVIMCTVSMPCKNVLFSATQKCPVLSWSKPSLNNSYNEGKVCVFSTDDQVAGCISLSSLLALAMLFSIVLGQNRRNLQLLN